MNMETHFLLKMTASSIVVVAAAAFVDLCIVCLSMMLFLVILGINTVVGFVIFSYYFSF